MVDHTKPQQALDFVQAQLAGGCTATDLHNAFFGNGGKFAELFPTRSEREAFVQTGEYQRISEIRESLRTRERTAS